MNIRINAPDNSYVAELNNVRIDGQPGIGCYTIVLVLNFIKTAKSDTKVRNATIRLVWGGNQQLMIGTATPDGGQTVQFPHHPSDFMMVFLLPVSAAQIEDIERRRNGGDFKLGLWFFGEVEQDGALRTFAGKDEITVRQQEWVEALGHMEYQKTFLFELPIPADSADTVRTLIGKAQYHLHRGHYDECVGECRKLLEAYKLNKNEEALLKKARANYKGTQEQRESMDISERMAVLRDALANATHIAHHHNPDCGYSRDQAKTIFGTTIALLSCTSTEQGEA